MRVPASSINNPEESLTFVWRSQGSSENYVIDKKAVRVAEKLFKDIIELGPLSFDSRIQTPFATLTPDRLKVLIQFCSTGELPTDLKPADIKFFQRISRTYQFSLLGDLIDKKEPKDLSILSQLQLAAMRGDALEFAKLLKQNPKQIKNLQQIDIETFDWSTFKAIKEINNKEVKLVLVKSWIIPQVLKLSLEKIKTCFEAIDDADCWRELFLQLNSSEDLYIKFLALQLYDQNSDSGLGFQEAIKDIEKKEELQKNNYKTDQKPLIKFVNRWCTARFLEVNLKTSLFSKFPQILNLNKEEIQKEPTKMAIDAYIKEWIREVYLKEERLLNPDYENEEGDYSDMQIIREFSANLTQALAKDFPEESIKSLLGEEIKILSEAYVRQRVIVLTKETLKQMQTSPLVISSP